jgi:hypothetical protein
VKVRKQGIEKQWLEKVKCRKLKQKQKGRALTPALNNQIL